MSTFIRFAVRGFCAAALLALAISATTSSVCAQATTFNVTVGAKTASNPNQGGFDAAFYIDGVEARELTLTRGVTYTFQMQNVPAMHPFYISTSEVGASSGVYTDGVTGNFASGNGTLTFTPGETAPDLLYYQCAAHARMGWRINIVDGTSDVPDGGASSMLRVAGLQPNPAVSATVLPVELGVASEVRVELFNVIGQNVLTLSRSGMGAGEHALQLDLSGLEQGVYVYRVVASTNSGESTVSGMLNVVR